MFGNSSYVETVINRRPFGWEYTEESKLGLDHFKFEEIDPFYWHDLIQENWYWAFYAAAVYVAVIFGLQRWMRDRKPYSLKTPLFLWNAGLGAFSIFGFVRTAPAFIKVLEQDGGFYESICKKTKADVQLGCWCLLFILSKYVELGDTVFIVLRKRPLVFLQWYHHLATMITVWLLSPYMEPVTRWYTVLNYGVHSLMYPYFALRAIGVHVPNFIANIITTLQLSQMITGLFVNVLSMYYQQTGYDCCRYRLSIQIFSVLYGSFFILFGKLFYDSVIKSGRKQRDKLSINKKLD